MKIKLYPFAAATLLACALASCSNSAGGDVTNFSLPSDDPTSEVTITFWHCLGHDKTTNLQKIVDSFNTEYAGKYKVVAEKTAGDYSSLASYIKTKLAASEVPAMTMGYPDSFAAYMTNDVNQSNIYKLDNFINDPTYGYSAEEIADFVPEYYAEGKNYQFSGVWSMPMYKSTEVMYYNANYFAGDNVQTKKKLENDATYNEKVSVVEAAAADVTQTALDDLKTYVKSKNGYAYDIPETWEAMYTMAAQMKADMKTEGLVNEFYPVGYDSDSNMLISQWAERGIAYTQNSDECASDPSKHYLFKNAEAKAFVSDTVEKINQGLLITKGTLGGSKYTNTYFTDVKTAVSIGSTGGSSYQVSSNFKVGLAAVPHAEGKTAKYIQQGPSICFFNNDNPYIHKGSWLFYKALAETTNNAKLALENSYDPVRVSSYETTEYQNWIAKKDRGLNYAIPAMTSTLKNNYMTSPVFVGSDTARDKVGEILADVVNSRRTVDEAFNIAYNACVQ